MILTSLVGNAVLSGALSGAESTTPKSGGGLLSTALGGVTSILPQLTNLVGFDVSANVDLVKKYGIDSWNATTSPEIIEIKITEIAKWADDLFQNNSTSYALTEYNKVLKQALTYYKHLRSNHANATSTKSAYDKMISKLNSLLKFETQLVNDLRSNNLKVTSIISTAYGVTDIFTSDAGHDFGTDAHNNRTPFQSQYNEYTITGGNVDIDFSNSSPVINDTNSNYATKTSTTSKVTVTKDNTSNYLLMGGALLLLFGSKITKYFR